MGLIDYLRKLIGISRPKPAQIQPLEEWLIDRRQVLVDEDHSSRLPEPSSATTAAIEPAQLRLAIDRFHAHWNRDEEGLTVAAKDEFYWESWSRLDDVLLEAAKYPEVRLNSLLDVIDQLRERRANAASAARGGGPIATSLVALLDTETTGLSKHDEPISVGAILAEVSNPGGILIREIDRYYGLREPSVPIHPRAAAVHGMSINDLRGREFDRARLLGLLSRANLFVAHNAKFDRRMLLPLFPMLRYGDWACSLYGLRLVWKSEQRSLDALCAEREITRAHPHNAMTDCEALLTLLLCHSGKTARSRTYMGHLVARPWAPPLDD